MISPKCLSSSGLGRGNVCPAVLLSSGRQLQNRLVNSIRLKTEYTINLSRGEFRLLGKFLPGTNQGKHPKNKYFFNVIFALNEVLNELSGTCQ